jgi:hypothetical protein
MELLITVNKNLRLVTCVAERRILEYIRKTCPSDADLVMYNTTSCYDSSIQYIMMKELHMLTCEELRDLTVSCPRSVPDEV